VRLQPRELQSPVALKLLSWRSQGCVTPQRKLHVGYMLPHHNLTGGMKCLVEHIRLLRARGHTTVALHRRASEPSCAVISLP